MSTSFTDRQDRVRTAPAVDKCHGMLVWLIRKTDRFPRIRRTLGSRIEALGLEVLERVTLAAYARLSEKTRHLETANLKLDTLRQLWKVARQLGAIGDKGYGHGSKLLVAIGAEIGGWRKASAGRAVRP